MLSSSVMHLKPLLMVLTAALGTVTGGTMISSFANNNQGNRNGNASFLLSVNPSAQTVSQGASVLSTVSIVSVNGYSGKVALSLFFVSAKIPAVLSPSSVSVPARGIAKSTLTITGSTSIGNYTIIILGMASNQGKASYSSSTVTVQVVSNQDFTITASPPTIVNLIGSTNTTNIILSSVNGYSGTIALSVTTPFGYITVTGGQYPMTLTAGGTTSSTLQISTSSSTLYGTYNITVTGTSGPRVHATMISLKVVDPTPPAIEALNLEGYKFNTNTNLTISLQNIGSANTTLQFYTVRDVSQDSWTLVSWAGPTIVPTAIVAANILIGTSCNGCTYSGIIGLFTQFTPGHTYIITVTTARGNQFVFTVLY